MLSDDYSGPYLKKFAIPFFKGKISDWDTKRESILQILDRFKDNMVEGDQLTDYNSNNLCQTPLFLTLIAVNYLQITGQADKNK